MTLTGYWGIGIIQNEVQQYLRYESDICNDGNEHVGISLEAPYDLILLTGQASVQFAPSFAGDMILTVQVNGVDVGTITIPEGDTEGPVTTFSVSVSTGDTIRIVHTYEANAGEPLVVMLGFA